SVPSLLNGDRVKIQCLLPLVFHGTESTKAPTAGVQVMGCERGQNLPHAHQRSMSGPFPLSWWCSEEAGEAEKGDARIVGVATPGCARLIASRASSCMPGVVFPAARSVVTNCAFFLASALMNSSGWCGSSVLGVPRSPAMSTTFYHRSCWASWFVLSL